MIKKSGSVKFLGVYENYGKIFDVIMSSEIKEMRNKSKVSCKKGGMCPGCRNYSKHT